MQIHNKDDIEFITEFPCFFWDTLYVTFQEDKDDKKIKRQLWQTIKKFTCYE